MWSVRMRASRGEEHISGAEGLFTDAEVEHAVRDYLARARNHPKGAADGITVSVEKLKSKPKEIAAPGVSTLECRSTAEARKIITRLLTSEGVSENALKSALEVVGGSRAMRGAALVSVSGGKRLEPDRSRGVRTSRLGIERRARAVLARALARQGINNPTVKEALALASKTLSLCAVVAELCVSDDPAYTTGYVASRRLGYVRIPNIKRKGSPGGGRVYFLREDADVEVAMRYLESQPALVTAVPFVRGTVSLDELIDRADS